MVLDSIWVFLRIEQLAMERGIKCMYVFSLISRFVQETHLVRFGQRPSIPWCKFKIKEFFVAVEIY